MRLGFHIVSARAFVRLAGLKAMVWRVSLVGVRFVWIFSVRLVNLIGEAVKAMFSGCFCRFVD
ncbi:MAG: hypothetical protein LBQ18_00125 [Campylobacteraceae bacterium]|nr:hypothetical protein [Campylobacteraceae bacterium]